MQTEDKDDRNPLKTVIPIVHKITISPAEDSCPVCRSDKLYKLELVEIFDNSDEECKAAYFNSIKLFEMVEEQLRDKGLSEFDHDDDNFAIKLIFITSMNIIADFIVGEFLSLSNLGSMKVAELLGILSMAKVSMQLKLNQSSKNEALETLFSLDPSNLEDLSAYAKSLGNISLEAAKKILPIHQEDLKIQIENNNNDEINNT